MRDLEIRGAGNLLGAAQSGFITSVGFETYCELLAEAIAERLEAREREIIAACEAANAEPDVLAATLEFDALPDTMADDPWTGDSIAH